MSQYANEIIRLIATSSWLSRPVLKKRCHWSNIWGQKLSVDGWNCWSICKQAIMQMSNHLRFIKRTFCLALKRRQNWKFQLDVTRVNTQMRNYANELPELHESDWAKWRQRAWIYKWVVMQIKPTRSKSAHLFRHLFFVIKRHPP